MKKRKIEVPLQNGKELKPIMIKPNMGRIIKPMAKFPDLSGDGKVTKKDGGKGNPNKPKMKVKAKAKKRDKRVLIGSPAHVKTYAKIKREEKKMAADPIMFRSANVSRANYTGPKVVQPPVEYEKRQAKKDFFRKQRAKLKDFNQIYNKPNAKFPDLSGDGKVTKKDILMGKGVIDKPKMKKFSKSSTKRKLPKDTPERLKIKKTGRELQNALIKEKNKPVGQQNKTFINNLKGAIEEQDKKLTTNKTKPNMKKPKMKKPKMTAKEKLAAAKKAKRAPGKAVRDARKGVRDANQKKRVAARATAKTARRKTRATNLEGRITKKKERVVKRVNKTRAMGKLSKLTAKPAMKKPKMNYKKKK